MPHGTLAWRLPSSAPSDATRRARRRTPRVARRPDLTLSRAHVPRSPPPSSWTSVLVALAVIVLLPPMLVAGAVRLLVFFVRCALLQQWRSLTRHALTPRATPRSSAFGALAALYRRAPPGTGGFALGAATACVALLRVAR